MSQRTGQSNGSAESRDTKPPEVHWETSRARSHICDVAKTSSGPDNIVVSFGATQDAGKSGGELTVELMQQISLRPLTAKHLLDMLNKLVAEADANRSGVR